MAAPDASAPDAFATGDRPRLSRSAGPRSHRARIVEVDALRGMAIAAIAVVNTWQLTGQNLPGRRADSATWSRADWMAAALLQERFYPILAALFGVSFSLFLDAASARTTRPRLVAAQRLAVLGMLAAAHRLMRPGEVLGTYAVCGLLVLLPCSRLRGPTLVATGATATVAGLLLGGGQALVPGLFLLGLAAARLRPSPGTATLAATLVACGMLSLTATLGWASGPLGTRSQNLAYEIGALAGAAAYTAATLLALRGPARRLLLAVLVPLGRTALTCYVSSTVLIGAALPVLTACPGLALAAGGVLAVIQIMIARAWLSRRPQGPLEALWRKASWLGHRSHRARS